MQVAWLSQFTVLGAMYFIMVFVRLIDWCIKKQEVNYNALKIRNEQIEICTIRQQLLFQY